ncbi:AraC family transcriptional regulator [Vibrio sp. PP-XX7]
MTIFFHDLIDTLLSEREHINHIWFAGNQFTPPQFSYQVNFPRLELVIQGEYVNQIEDQELGIVTVNIHAGDTLYIPPNCWNKPEWTHDCSVLSLLFGRRQLGFSLVSKEADQPSFLMYKSTVFICVQGMAIDHILAGLNALASEPQKKPMDEYLLAALMSYSQSMISSSAPEKNRRSEEIYQSICIYIQENFHRAINRNSVAERFNISPNHLSRLFRKRGHMDPERLHHLASELAGPSLCCVSTPLNFRRVAIRCGYQDVNYFFRIFKNKTGCTPSEYRAQA